MLKLDTYSRNLRMTHAQWIYNLRADAAIYAKQGNQAAAGYLMLLARKHAEALIGKGC